MAVDREWRTAASGAQPAAGAMQMYRAVRSVRPRVRPRAPHTHTRARGE